MNARPNYSLIAALEAELLDDLGPVNTMSEAIVPSSSPRPTASYAGTKCGHCGSYDTGVDRRGVDGEWVYFFACQKCGYELTPE